MLALEKLAMCPSCRCHARASELACPHCGEEMRRPKRIGTVVGRLFGVVTLTLPLVVACSSSSASSGSPSSTTGNGGNGGASTVGSGGHGGSSTPTSSSFGGDSTTLVVSTYATSPTVGTGGSCGWPAPGDFACQTCASANCCNELSLCDQAGQAACEPIYDCVAACAGDDACITQCRDDSSSELVAYDALIGCLQSFCLSSCPGAAMMTSDAGADSGGDGGT